MLMLVLWCVIILGELECFFGNSLNIGARTHLIRWYKVRTRTKYEDKTLDNFIYFIILTL